MEQARYWMWAKRKQCLSSYGDISWEEQTFAEDSAGSLGGCIWPPRSYSCSFCRREFRSAQALGGHMNVHRRDRARLKQSPTTPHPETDDQILYDHQISIPPCTSVGTIGASSLSPSRVSSPSNTQGNYSEQTLISPYSCSSSVILHQHTKGSLFSPPSPSLTNSKKIEGEKNFVVHGNQPAGSGGGDGEEEAAAFISKRRRSNDASSLPFFLNLISVDRHHLQSDMLGVCTNPIEDLDLELRLGDCPKVK